ncbi:MAG: asparagine synthase [Sphingopyxis terrae]|nr:asparagine synthase [Sphingopyxis terrae]
MTGPRYLILIAASLRDLGDPIAQLRRSTDLETVFEKDGIAVLANQAQHSIHLGGHGVILGDLYRKHASHGLADELQSVERGQIVDGTGQFLIDDCWGRYVAVSAGGRGARVVRDPSGAVQCVYTRTANVIAFASHIDLVRAVGLWSPEIDWLALSRHLFSGGLPSAETSLRGVLELLPGTAADVQAHNVSLRELWSPWRYVASSKTMDRAEAIDRVYRAAERAVSETVSKFPRLLVGVSGGLDSSIVAAFAARAGASIKPITLITQDGDGDETPYAAHLCEALGATLARAQYRADVIDLGQAASPSFTRPTSRAEAQAYNSALRHCFRPGEIDAFLSGNGGDNVFAYSQSASALTDRYLAEGLGRGCLRTLADICALNGCGPIAAMRHASAKLPRSMHRYRWSPEPMLLSQEILRVHENTPIEHPWLHAPESVPPGKAAHVAQLLKIQQHLQANEDAIGIPVITPLMSQPVIEACLPIPTWEWCKGGQNRSVAREAFAGILPRAIVNRRTKGGPDSFCSQFISARRREIADRLLHGNVVASGIIDRTALETVLTTNSHITGFEYVRILTLLEAEAWSDYWRERSGSMPVSPERRSVSQ